MKFSTRTRYGLRFLIRLAAQPEGELLQLGQVAHEENISPGYLEQIVRALKPLGILRAVREAVMRWPDVLTKFPWKTYFCIWKGRFLLWPA